MPSNILGSNSTDKCAFVSFYALSHVSLNRALAEAIFLKNGDLAVQQNKPNVHRFD